MSGARAGPVIGPRLHVEMLATPEAGALLSSLVQAFLVDGLGRPPEAPEVVHVRLAVVEVATNVARHAYRGESPGPLLLELATEGERDLVVRVRDRGPEFDPRRAAPGGLPDPADLREGGYGLGIIREVMDDIQHHFLPEEGNVLILRKKLSS